MFLSPTHDHSTIHYLQDMVLPSCHLTSAEARLASLPELLGAIFVNLTILDLVRVQQVCRRWRWRDCVRNVSELQPALYKRATPVVAGDNPHFEDLDEDNTSVQPEGSMPLREHLNDVGR